MIDKKKAKSLIINQDKMIAPNLNPIYKNEEEKITQIIAHKNPIIWLINQCSFYNYMTQSFLKPSDIPLILRCTAKEANDMHNARQFPEFYDLCYRQ